MCVHTWFRKWRSCEMMIIVDSRSLSTSSSQRMVLMSRLLVGSSSSSTSGLANSACDQQHTQLPARCNLAHRAVVALDGNADAEQQFAGAGFCRIAVVLGKLRLEFGGVHVVVFRRLRVGVDRVALAHAGPHFGVAHQHHVNYTLVLVAELVLAQVGHAFVLFLRDVAGRRLQRPAEDLHQRRLAGAVGTDQAVAIALAELGVDVFEEGLGPELLGDIGGDEHGEILRMKVKRTERWVTDFPCQSGRSWRQKRQGRHAPPSCFRQTGAYLPAPSCGLLRWWHSAA
jgi:hypothetical protein